MKYVKDETKENFKAIRDGWKEQDRLATINYLGLLLGYTNDEKDKKAIRETMINLSKEK